MIARSDPRRAGRVRPSGGEAASLSSAIVSMMRPGRDCAKLSARNALTKNHDKRREKPTDERTASPRHHPPRLCHHLSGAASPQAYHRLRQRRLAWRWSRPTLKSRLRTELVTPHSFIRSLIPIESGLSGVLIWPDASAAAVAAHNRQKHPSEGYSVCTQSFYRVQAPFTDASKFNFQNPDDMAKLKPLMASVTRRNAEKDAAATLPSSTRKEK